MAIVPKDSHTEDAFTTAYNSSQLAGSDERDDQLAEIRYEGEQRRKKEEEQDDKDGDFTSSQATLSSWDNEDPCSDADCTRELSSDDTLPVQIIHEELRLHSTSVEHKNYDPEDWEGESEEEADE